MASVRMTGILRDEIMQNAMRAFDKANPDIKYKPKHVNEIVNHFTSNPLQVFWKDVHTKIKNTFKQDSSDNVKTTVVDNFQVHLGENELHFDVEQCPKFIAYHPNKEFNTGYYNKIRIDLKKGDLYDKVLADVLDIKLAQDKRDETRQTYRDGIHDLIHKCTTVHRMLDVEPSMETFVPPEKIQAMHIKMTRAKVAQYIEEDIEFDASLTKQVALTSKLMGA